MALQDLNRWHWLTIGAVVGGLLSYSRLYDLTSGKRVTPEDRAPSQAQIISAEELIAELRRTTGEGNVPQQAELTIYPQINDGFYVAGKVFRCNTEGIESYRDILATSPIPSKAIASMVPQPHHSLRDDIAEVARNNPRIKYRTAWWASPAATIGLWGGGSILTIGVVWPVLISLAIGAGLAPKRTSRAERKKEAEYLSRFKSNKDDQLQSGTPRVAKPVDNQLKTLTNTLEKNLTSTGPSPAESQSITQTSAAPIRRLESGPIEATSATEAPKDDVDWGGEFYPVAHPKQHPLDPQE